MSDKLEPCPFCGESRTSWPQIPDGVIHQTAIHCISCQAHGPAADNTADALASWNRRAFLALRDEKVRAEAKAEAYDEVAVMVKPQDHLIQGPRRQLCEDIYKWATSRAAALRKSEPVPPAPVETSGGGEGGK